MLDWYAYGIGKVPAKVATTYQNISDAWSLLIDQKWHDRITAIKANDGGLSYVEFFEYRKNKMSIPLFNIYCATGSNREYYAERTDLIQLGQTTQAIYFAKLTNEGEQSEPGADRRRDQSPILVGQPGVEQLRIIKRRRNAAVTNKR